MLCARGGLHALAGFYTNPEALRDSARRVRGYLLTIIRYGLCLRLVCDLLARLKSKDAFNSTSGGMSFFEQLDGEAKREVVEDDISESLRMEIVSSTMQSPHISAFDGLRWPSLICAISCTRR